MTGKRILVIEDEPAVLSMISDCLLDCGYTVIRAADGEEGLKQIAEAHPAVDLIITDIVMPRKNGLDLIVEVRERWPMTNILAISGGGRDKTMDLLTKAQILGCHAVMQKPLDIPELERTVARLVGETW
jgi:CheY-like chemotaxis protein